MSGYSFFKIKGIIYHWLSKDPPLTKDVSGVKYLVYDGTYFHKDGCFIILMDAVDQAIINAIYVLKEGFNQVHGWFKDLENKCLNPLYVTMDGEQGAMRAFEAVWPTIHIQRCLYHIQREGMRWLRTFPPTVAGRELRILLKGLSSIKSVKDRNSFVSQYQQWLRRHQRFVLFLPMNRKVNYDLKRTMTLINRALPQMFHYLMDSKIPPTSNMLESLYSRIKAAYRQHRGLTQKHKIQFLKWYCYFENQQKINNL